MMVYHHNIAENLNWHIKQIKLYPENPASCLLVSLTQEDREFKAYITETKLKAKTTKVKV